MIVIKSLGIGMAIAVLLDATIIRALLVPATMRLLGQRAWWAPSQLVGLSSRLGFSHVETDYECDTPDSGSQPMPARQGPRSPTAGMAGPTPEPAAEALRPAGGSRPARVSRRLAADLGAAPSRRLRRAISAIGSSSSSVTTNGGPSRTVSPFVPSALPVPW